MRQNEGNNVPIRSFFVPFRDWEIKRMKTAEIESLILQLLTTQPEVSIRSIAEAAGFSPDNETQRKAIQRALISLKENNSIIPKGAGRSRVYVLSAAEKQKVSESEGTGNDNYFAGINLSPESENLLKNVSQPIAGRMPVG